MVSRNPSPFTGELVHGQDIRFVIGGNQVYSLLFLLFLFFPKIPVHALSFCIYELENLKKHSNHKNNDTDFLWALEWSKHYMMIQKSVDWFRIVGLYS